MKRDTRKAFTVRWGDVAAPDGMALSIGQALHTIRWLCERAADPKYRRPGRWITVTPYMALSATSGGVEWIVPIVSVRDLHRRLQWAVLAMQRVEVIRSWRQDLGIHVDAKRRIYGLHEYGSGLRQILCRNGSRRLIVSLNSIHPTAMGFGGVSLRLVRPHDGRRPLWCAVLHYTLDGSTWEHTLTTERVGESIDAFGERAASLLEALLGTAMGPRGHALLTREQVPIVDVDWSAGGGAVSVFVDRGGCDCEAGERGYIQHRLACNLVRVDGPFATRAEAEDAALARIRAASP